MPCNASCDGEDGDELDDCDVKVDVECPSYSSFYWVICWKLCNHGVLLLASILGTPVRTGEVCGSFGIDVSSARQPSSIPKVVASTQARLGIPYQ